MARMHRIVRVGFELSSTGRKVKITHVRCEGPKGQDEGIMTVDQVTARMANGEQFFVLRTLWSRVHDHGGHIQADPDSCNYTNLENMPELTVEELATVG